MSNVWIPFLTFFSQPLRRSGISRLQNQLKSDLRCLSRWKQLKRHISWAASIEAKKSVIDLLSRAYMMQGSALHSVMPQWNTYTRRESTQYELLRPKYKTYSYHMLDLSYSIRTHMHKQAVSTTGSESVNSQELKTRFWHKQAKAYRTPLQG